MKINSAASTPTRRGPADWFTGTVWQDPIIASFTNLILQPTSFSSVK